MTSLWQQVLTRLQRDNAFRTVRDSQPFTVRIEDDDSLCVTTSKGQEERIYRRDFQKAENADLVKIGVRPIDLTNAGVGKGPSYIAGIINTIAQEAV